ncbi:MAG: nitrogenase molybdenum-iron protein beta chain [Actinomycetota bacterium]|nr:nitrogenase molybdenum-iron protein beta chain [Actinomycetota bacterium]
MLDHTPVAVMERHALRINPAKTCQPIGALYAASGLHRCLPHSHGSQGCCSYHRSHLTRHFREPVMASSSSFTEGASVFGGASNLVQALGTIFSTYGPDVVAVHTTCLSETIGDDIPSIIARAREEGAIPDGKHVIHASTPSYSGSHVTGFAAMAAGMVNYFAEEPTSSRRRKDGRTRVNIVPGFVEPSDMREVRRIAELMNLTPTVLPDTSGVLDAPATGTYEFYPKGGVTVDELRGLGRAVATVALGPQASRAAAVAVENRCYVPREILDLPIGIAATDRFVGVLRRRAAYEVPGELLDERGQLVDLMADARQHLHGKKVAIFGDPDHVVAMAEFVADLGMRPVHILTGTPGKSFEKRVGTLLAGRSPDANVRSRGDLFLLHQWMKNDPVDLLIGTSYGKHLARAEDVPFVRYGWPILDRFGHSYFPSVGYRGGLRLMEKILDALLDRRDRDAPDEEFELIL